MKAPESISYQTTSASASKEVNEDGNCFLLLLLCHDASVTDQKICYGVLLQRTGEGGRNGCFS